MYILCHKKLIACVLMVSYVILIPHYKIHSIPSHMKSVLRRGTMTILGVPTYKLI